MAGGNKYDNDRSLLFSLIQRLDSFTQSSLLDRFDQVVAERPATGSDEIANQGFDLGFERVRRMPLGQKSCNLSLNVTERNICI